MKLFKKEKPVIIGDYRQRKRLRFLSGFNLPDLSESTKVNFLNKFSLLFHAILACVLVFAIEWISRHSIGSAITFCIGSPLTYLYNVLLIFASLLIVYLFKRRALVRMVISVFWMLLGIINGCILASRVTPFNFTDLKLVGDLLSMKSSQYFTTQQEIAIIVALVVLALFLVFLGIKGPKFSGRVHIFRNLGCLLLCVAALPFITKAAIQSDILAGYFGNLAQGYKDYGFVYSFSASVLDTGMSKPDNYTEETIQTIQNDVDTPDTTIDTTDLPNIIFVQLETFIDPYELNFLSYSEDPIPNFHSLMENYSSGYLTVPVVGAGTANTEFEVLTGMGIRFFGLGEYPYKTVLKGTSCESAASVLSDLGYGTHALHNNGGNFYGRANIFAQFGFDSYTSKELMNITEYNEISSWPTDDILIDETLKALDSTEDQSDFIYTITVQSHGSYPEYQVFEDPAIEVTGGETQEKHYQWEYYINELHEVDQFVGNLIDTLSQRDEKTIVVLYGDHLPTMGLEDSDMKTGNLYDTTYVTWNNFGLEKTDKDVAAYQLMAYITDQLGIHEGTMFTYHQSEMDAGLTEDASYVANWELLQYDLLYGDRYAYNGEDLYPASNLVMGVQDVVINNTYLNYDNTQLIITGENFTPWSKVYIDGEKVSTEYVSDKMLKISTSKLVDGSEIIVNQVGSSNTVFRSSNSVNFEAPEGFGEEVEDESEVIPDTEIITVPKPYGFSTAGEAM
jgi:phosphoglycerol transferase MdoB-like AlkP superfamily enzyme